MRSHGNPSNPASACPECGSACVLIGSQQLKMCTCGWRDENWTLEEDQEPVYG